MMNRLFGFLVSIVIIANAAMIGIRVSFSYEPQIEKISTYLWYSQIAVIWVHVVWIWKKSRSFPVIRLLIVALSSIPIDTFRVLSLSLILPEISFTPRSQRVWVIWKESFSAIAWAMLIITCSLWVMAIVYTDFFSNSTAWIFVKKTDPKFFNVEKYFGSNIASFLTMLQIITMDHWMSSIARPLITVYPIMLVFPLSLLFVFTYGLLNVLVGLVVRCSILSNESHSSSTSPDSSSSLIQRLLVRRKIAQIIHQLKQIHD